MNWHLNQIKRNAVDNESASQLLITAGDNPQTLNQVLRCCGVNSVTVYLLKMNRVTDLIGVGSVLQIVRTSHHRYRTFTN